MSIVIIGNGPSATEQKLGSKIDAFDIVVRLNNYITEGYEEYVGSKTTVWGRSDASDIYKKTISDFDKIIVFLPMQNYNRADRLAKIKNILMQKNVELCPKWISSQTSKDLQCVKREWPSTGILAINYFILKNLKNIHIHGFDCFLNDKYYYNDKKATYKGHNRIKEKKFIDRNIKNKVISILE